MFNVIMIVGNLGRDPELKYTPTGTPIAQFSIASNDRKKGKSGEWEQLTTWFRVTVFGKQAEACAQYLTKGRQVFVQGRMRCEDWTDRDGAKRYTLEVLADQVKFLGKPDDREDKEQFQHDQAKGSEPDHSVPDDDVPF